MHLTREEIESLPRLDDPVKIQVMRLVDRLSSLAYFTKDPILLPATIRGYELTLKYGVSEISPGLFGSIGVVMVSFLSDFAVGQRLAEYSLLLQKKVDRSNLARVYLVVYAGVSSKGFPAILVADNCFSLTNHCFSTRYRSFTLRSLSIPY